MLTTSDKGGQCNFFVHRIHKVALHIYVREVHTKKIAPRCKHNADEQRTMLEFGGCCSKNAFCRRGVLLNWYKERPSDEPTVLQKSYEIIIVTVTEETTSNKKFWGMRKVFMIEITHIGDPQATDAFDRFDTTDYPQLFSEPSTSQLFLKRIMLH